MFFGVGVIRKKESSRVIEPWKYYRKFSKVSPDIIFQVRSCRNSENGESSLNFDCRGVEMGGNAEIIFIISNISIKVLFQVRSYLNSQNCKRFRGVWNVVVLEWGNSRFTMKFTKVSANGLFQVRSYLNSQIVKGFVELVTWGYRNGWIAEILSKLRKFRQMGYFRYDRTWIQKMVRFEGEMVNPRVFEKADVEYFNAFSNISAKVYIWGMIVPWISKVVSDSSEIGKNRVLVRLGDVVFAK